jgi:hypothetical protein
MLLKNCLQIHFKDYSRNWEGGIKESSRGDEFEYDTFDTI